jgi:alpha-methylacyl-CoA racemase
MSGPLTGVRIVEMAGIGPGPFAGMMLADHGAEVIRVDRPGPASGYRDVLARSRKSIALDLKTAEGVQVVRDLCREADGLIEGFRPGVMERLGLGPEVLRKDNPRLVYGRMTGWGQDGPMAQAAGHDINYIALSGALHAIGRAGERPTPPLNLVGDFGGGGMLLAFGMVSAILAARTSGRGEVVDCAMVDGAALLMGMFFSMSHAGRWRDERGTNFLDSGAHYYETYETADGRYVSVGSIEPAFYAELLRLAGLEADDPLFDRREDAATWPAAKARLEAVFKTKTRDEWCSVMEGTDVCFAPVLSMGEAPSHPHNAARGTFVEAFGLTQPAPAPRYADTPTNPPRLTSKGADGEALLRALGYDAARIDGLRKCGVLG